ncbi:MAG TPA: T9SS type A sorting domain-containing protein [Bacteroidota bacterium]|nr:T9SS type A sorting domain-containing protein [Bacteroidota bacterium]
MKGDSTGDTFSVVSNVGDVNADGYDDLLVGAYGGNYAKLYFGGSVFDTIPDMVFRCDQPHSWYGYALAGGKDINGDEYPDFVIGAPYYWNGGRPFGISETGKVSVFFGGPGLDTIPDVELNCDGWYYWFGTSVSLGDVNSDGYSDIIIGADNDDIDARGRVFIYFGGRKINTTPDVILEGQPFDNLGTSVAYAGDVNKDGCGDLLIGAPQFHLTGPRFQGGKAFLVYGGKDISLVNSTIFVGDSIPPGQLGRVVAGMGDINNDGFNDIGIMGLRRQKIFLGSESTDTTASSSLYPIKGFSFIGGLGDFNKDGFDDYVSVSDSVRIYTGASSISKLPAHVLPWGYPVCCLGNKINDKKIEIAYGVNTYSIGFGIVYVYSFDIPDGIKKQNDAILPKEFELYQNYPNPFNSETIIEYDITKSGFIEIEVYNLLGQKIRTLVGKTVHAGNHKIRFDAYELPGGVYFYRLKTTNGTIIKPMLYLK